MVERNEMPPICSACQFRHWMNQPCADMGIPTSSIDIKPPVPGDTGKRDSIYGAFADNAKFYARWQRLFIDSSGYAKLTEVQRNVIDQIGVKFSRIMTGDPNYVDNWTDVAGYALLAEAECKGVKR